MITKVNSYFSQTYHIVKESCVFVSKLTSFIKIFFHEALTTLTSVCPKALHWLWIKFCRRKIMTFPVSVTVDGVARVAYVYYHGKKSSLKKKQGRALLLAHGDCGHPFTMLHFVRIARKTSPIFSFYIDKTLVKDDLVVRQKLFELALDKIVELVSEHREFDGLIGAGHSAGAFLLAYNQFVKKDPRIKATFSVAGPLNVSQLEEILKVKSIKAEALCNPQLPIYQILPTEDWCCGKQDEMAVRPSEHCYSVPGMHLSGLYAKETRTLFKEFVQTFA